MHAIVLVFAFASTLLLISSFIMIRPARISSFAVVDLCSGQNRSARFMGQLLEAMKGHGMIFDQHFDDNFSRVIENVTASFSEKVLTPNQVSTSSSPPVDPDKICILKRFARCIEDPSDF